MRTSTCGRWGSQIPVTMDGKFSITASSSGSPSTVTRRSSRGSKHMTKSIASGIASTTSSLPRSTVPHIHTRPGPNPNRYGKANTEWIKAKLKLVTDGSARSNQRGYARQVDGVQKTWHYVAEKAWLSQITSRPHARHILTLNPAGCRYRAFRDQEKFPSLSQGRDISAAL